MAEYYFMGPRESPSRLDAYESVFSALAHAARRRVLLTIYFNGGSMTAGDIAAIFAHSWQTTTRHLQVLEAAGLITHERQGRMRIYRIQRKRLALVRDWLVHFHETDNPKGGTAMLGKQPNKPGTEATKGTATNDVPQFFRLNLEVGDLEAAISFYTKLLGIEGRKQAGSRCYFECGPVTLQVLDVSSQRQPHPAAKALYFTVNDLEAVYERAQGLHCLSDSDVHDAAGGGIVVRPWGERSFYAQDSWGNPLCFIEQGTVYTGRD